MEVKWVLLLVESDEHVVTLRVAIYAEGKWVLVLVVSDEDVAAERVVKMFLIVGYGIS